MKDLASRRGRGAASQRVAPSEPARDAAALAARAPFAVVAPPIAAVDPAAGRRCLVIATSAGCPSNLLEAAAWRAHLQSLGYGPAESPETADVIIVNTCAVRGDMEERAATLIDDLQRRFGADRRILVTGCLEGINPERLREVFQGPTLPPPGGDLAFQATQHRFDPADFGRLETKHKVVLFLRRWYFGLERLLGRRFQPLHNLLRSVMVSERFYLLTVAVGCLGHCTYCGIRNAKGTVRSRGLEGILAEFDRALADGHQDFWLVADDLGCWGQDLGAGLPELLRGLLSRPGDFRLVINYLGPQFLMRYADELATIFRDRRFVLVNVPIQSGSDAVLRRMGRREPIAGVLGWVEGARRSNPSLVRKTNILVGFPGETWADLVRSWRAMMRFDAIVAEAYSPRPRTEAALLPGRIGPFQLRLRLLATRGVGLVVHARVLARSLFA